MLRAIDSFDNLGYFRVQKDSTTYLQLFFSYTSYDLFLIWVLHVLPKVYYYELLYAFQLGFSWVLLAKLIGEYYIYRRLILTDARVWVPLNYLQRYLFNLFTIQTIGYWFKYLLYFYSKVWYNDKNCIETFYLKATLTALQVQSRLYLVIVLWLKLTLHLACL